MPKRPFIPYLLTVGFLAALPAVSPAQGSDTARRAAEPPVRYDDDLLPPSFHQSRRDSVLAALPAIGVAIMFSAPERNRENDVNYEYRQDSDLYYLTGTHEPSSVLILAPGGVEIDGRSVAELLLVPPRNPNQETWTGRRFGAARAQEQLGIAHVVTNDRLGEVVDRLHQANRRLFHLPLPDAVASGSELARQIALVRQRFAVFDTEGDVAGLLVGRLLGTETAQEFERNKALLQRFPPSRFETPRVRELLEGFASAGSLAAWLAWRRDRIDTRYADGVLLRERLTALRTIKTPEELRLLRHAIDITAAAHREAMKSIEPDMHEYEVEALIEYVFQRNGAEHPGFPSIVGSGENSVILHYESNRRRMRAGDVVVMDVGAEYHGYTADVTRTVPVGGRFTPEQRAIYEIVLRAQEAGIQETRAGRPFNAPHRAAFAVVAQGLRELGIIREDNQARRFFNHGTSHYLGLYVHDVGTGGGLVPGTVITVEPGIYIAPAPDVDPKWWNIGVRIEDDVLVTDGEPLVLSAGAPRTIPEIESLMREPGLANDPAGVVARDRR